MGPDPLLEHSGLSSAGHWAPSVCSARKTSLPGAHAPTDLPGKVRESLTPATFYCLPAWLVPSCPSLQPPLCPGPLASQIPNKLLCPVPHPPTPGSVQPEAQASASILSFPSRRGTVLVQPPLGVGEMCIHMARAEADTSLYFLAAQLGQSKHATLLIPLLRGCPLLSQASPDLARVGMAEPGLGDVGMPCGWVPAHGVQHQSW